MVQVGVSAVQIAHVVGTVLYLRFVNSFVLGRCNGDGTPVGEDCVPEAAFEVRGVCNHNSGMQLTEPLMASMNPQHPITLHPPVQPNALYEADTSSTPLSDADSTSIDEEEVEEDAALREEVSYRKNHRKFDGRSIITSLLDNHRGHNPMVLPYERLYERSSSDDMEMENV